MDVYLVQHGLAVANEQDPQRPLSDEGRAAMRKVADYLADRKEQLIDPPISAVLHSGKLRARQTAEILVKALGPQITPTTHENMNPKDDANIVYNQLMADRDQTAAIMLVGHLPHLGRLAGLLLAEDADKSPIRLVNSGVLKIGPLENNWAVEWYVTPACV
ncbi:MAG: phosphohistidine phosphatase SixA [Planctomycetota bacterium]|nr:MAG: phosphohistidine phosphatase SixA [Planctomycetota bacterium]